MVITILIISTVIAIIANAIMDNMDFHGKDRIRSMKDFWHLLKDVWIIGLTITGVFLTKLDFHNNFYIILYLTVLLLSKIFIWDYFFNSHTEFFIKIDETLDIKTGIKWLDRLLGFDK